MIPCYSICVLEMCHFSLNVQACSSIFWDDEPNDDHMFEVWVNPSTKYRCVFGIGGHIIYDKLIFYYVVCMGKQVKPILIEPMPNW